MSKDQPSETIDEDLMRAYLEGDAAAFETLYRRHSGKVYGYLFKKLQNRESTDEVFQAVFLKLHQARHGFDFAYPFTQWLFVVAKTTLLDHFRKAGRQIKTTDLELGAEPVSQNDPSPTLKGEKESGLLKNVSAEQREAIEMRVMDERSYVEIAARLNRSEQSVRQLVSRGLKKLRLLRGES